MGEHQEMATSQPGNTHYLNREWARGLLQPGGSPNTLALTAQGTAGCHHDQPQMLWKVHPIPAFSASVSRPLPGAASSRALGLAGEGVGKERSRTIPQRQNCMCHTHIPAVSSLLPSDFIHRTNSKIRLLWISRWWLQSIKPQRWGSWWTAYSALPAT